ncbi:hypothetical protein FRIGORI9N_420028 [Frigoribacterium sp. 9N]|nr:hypothetical protein FRIGORI9N_420028 [Frigoribacterium sp. 9N]
MPVLCCPPRQVRTDDPPLEAGFGLLSGALLQVLSVLADALDLGGDICFDLFDAARQCLCTRGDIATASGKFAALLLQLFHLSQLLFNLLDFFIDGSQRLSLVL